MTSKIFQGGFILTFIFCQLAFAGGVSSGGGGAMVCRDPNSGAVISAQLLDLWEGQNIRGWKIKDSYSNVDGHLAIALDQIKRLNTVLAAGIQKEIEKIRSERILLPSGVEIQPPQDALNKYKQKGCALEGMMLYDGDLDRLTINDEIFSKLENEAQIAAAWFHEGAYKVLREFGQTDSKATRQLTACLFTDSNCFESLKFISNTTETYKCQSDDITFNWSENSNSIELTRIKNEFFGDAQALSTKSPISGIGYPIGYGPKAFGKQLSKFGFVTTAGSFEFKSVQLKLKDRTTQIAIPKWFYLSSSPKSTPVLEIETSDSFDCN